MFLDKAITHQIKTKNTKHKYKHRNFFGLSLVMRNSLNITVPLNLMKK